ncbi:energy transducer TonB [Enterovirga sp. GCM10030262]|uniref:energy transducer TonB n=1 Tax=Enterovirga sp. GCM10030262 TaxID=3273391 RepID=UPI00361F66AF
MRNLLPAKGIAWFFCLSGCAVPDPALGGSDDRVVPAYPARLTEGRISTSDYPATAMTHGDHGRTSVTLLVDARGRVTKCKIESSSGSAALDDVTCDLMRARFRYEPARDAGGKAVPSMTTESVNWRLSDWPG